MVSIKKFLLFAILASVLIGAVCVKAEESGDKGKEPAKEEVSAEKSEAGADATSGSAETAHQTVTEFGKKIFSGFKKAGKSIFAHIPFFSHGAAANEKSTEGSETSQEAEAEAPAEDVKAESKEEPKEETKEEAKEEAKEEGKKESA